MCPIVGAAVAVTALEARALGGAAVASGVATGATEPARGRPPLATRATPTASSSTPASTVNERAMRLFSDAHRMPSERASFANRRTRAAATLRERAFGALLASPGADLFYLAGYQIFASERLTCLVLDRDGAATIVCPKLEAPRAAVAAPDIGRATWEETEDPYAMIASLVRASGGIALADQMWAAFV